MLWETDVVTEPGLLLLISLSRRLSGKFVLNVKESLVSIWASDEIESMARDKRDRNLRRFDNFHLINSFIAVLYILSHFIDEYHCEYTQKWTKNKLQIVF